MTLEMSTISDRVQRLVNGNDASRKTLPEKKAAKRLYKPFHTQSFNGLFPYSIPPTQVFRISTQSHAYIMDQHEIPRNPL